MYLEAMRCDAVRCDAMRCDAPNLPTYTLYIMNAMIKAARQITPYSLKYIMWIVFLLLISQREIFVCVQRYEKKNGITVVVVIIVGRVSILYKTIQYHMHIDGITDRSAHNRNTH